MQKSLKGLSFFDHLDELKGRLIKGFIAFVLAAIIFYQFIDGILDFLIDPIGKVVFTSPADAFVARINLTLLGGLLLSLPIIIYQIWQFVAAGLKTHEKKYVAIFGPVSLFLFFLGGLFAYFVAIPNSMRFLLSFGSDVVQPMITIDNYISYVGTLILAFGVTFELPLIMFFLVKIGIATPEFLIQQRRYAIVIILIISAVITPSDVVSLLIMSIPLLFLYEVGVWVVKLTYKP